MTKTWGPYLLFPENNDGAEWAIALAGRRFYTGCKINEKDRAIEALEEFASDYKRLPQDWKIRVIGPKDAITPRTVYFVSTEDFPRYPVKIGMAIRQEDRLTGLQISCPYKLSILATCEGGAQQERNLHLAFAQYRLRGEWFRRGRKLMAFIAKLNASVAVLGLLVIMSGTNQALAAPIVIQNDRGGYVVDYAERLARWRSEGRKVEIAGRCDSACTAYLAIACVRKGARLGFHRSAGPNRSANKYADIYLMSTYPPKVRAWIKAQGGLTQKLIYLSGGELRKATRACR